MSEIKSKNKFQQLGSDILVGGSLGAVSKTLMAPMERIKLLLQTQNSNPLVLSGQIKPATSISECFRRVLAEQGPLAFWRGNLVNILRYAPQQGSALAFNDLFNDLFPYYDPHQDFGKAFLVRLASGGLAGALANTICYPFDFARTRLASDLVSGKGRFKGIADCIATTVRQEGVKGLYTGINITIAGAIVTRAGQLGVFKQIQDMNPYKSDTGTLGYVSAFVAITVARTLNLPFNYPFDTIRRRMMLQSEIPIEQRTYKGAVDCIRQVFRNEGFRGVYRGMVPEIFRGVGGSLVIVAYDRIKYTLEHSNKN